MKPIFLICQGRSGGTIVAHALAEALSAPLLLEPFHESLRDWVRRQPDRTPEHLRHDGVMYPYRGYKGMHLSNQATLASTHAEKMRWLQSLVDQAVGPPVIKILRLWGHMQRLREFFPEVTIIHLFRDWEQQWKSYSGLGFSRDYFGEYRFGYSHWASVPEFKGVSDKDFHGGIWGLALAEGRAFADLSVSLNEVATFAMFFTRHD
jgi:hypothetical protein